ncbi:uncharacterized protein LOC129299488 isoform X2 [Prosopis cineraria]|nr:uncharacterized protein LOC129299488 isoform X2 [Prosopis cineraria]
MQDTSMDQSIGDKGVRYHQYLFQLRQQAARTMLIILASIVSTKSGDIQQTCLRMLFSSLNSRANIILVTTIVASLIALIHSTHQVAGGAPFITCRNCFKLLQLPADFLLFKRVCHQLKCGHCSEILKFSLQDRSHIVSYDPSRHGDQSE